METHGILPMIEELFEIGYNWTYYKVKNVHKVESYPNKNAPGAVYESIMMLDLATHKSVRSAYNILDFLDNIAGWFQLLQGGFGIVLFSISRHSFILSAIKKLFLVKSTDSHLFDEKKKQKENIEHSHNLKGIQKYLSPEFTNKVKDQKMKNNVLKYHRKISLTTKQSIKLYFIHIFARTFKCLKFPQYKQFIALKKEGKKRVEKSFDIVKISNDIKYLKLLSKFKTQPEVDLMF